MRHSEGSQQTYIRAPLRRGAASGPSARWPTWNLMTLSRHQALFRGLRPLERRAGYTLASPVFGLKDGVHLKSNWVSLQNALSYCLTHKLGLMEASDIFVPLSGKTPSNPENFRAAHLKNLKDMRNARRVLLTPSSAEECTTEVNQYKVEIANALFNVQLDSIWLAQLDSSTLEFLAANCAKSKEKLAKSPNTPTPILVQLARDKSNKASGHFLAHLVLNNAATPSSLLEELAATGSKGMCIEIAYHTNASPQLLRKLLDNSRGMPGIRLGIAKNPNTPFDILERLANDSLQQAREAAKSHPTFRQNKKQQG